MTHEITLQVSVTPRRARLLLAVLLSVGLPTVSSTADVSTLTLYYPVPTGVFDPPATDDDALVTYEDTTIEAPADDIVIGLSGATRVVFNGRPATNSEPTPAYPAWAPSYMKEENNVEVRIFGELKVDGCIGLAGYTPAHWASPPELWWRCQHP